MLRREMLAVDHAVMHFVAEFVAQGLQDHVEGAALVVRQQILHVLQQERGGALGRDDPRDVEKERALRRAFETVRPAQRVFLADAGDRKRLAREAAEQHVVARHVFGRERDDVADQRVLAAAGIILAIGLGRKVVPLAREHAIAAVRLEAHANPADAGEQIDEAKLRVAAAPLRLARARLLQQIAQGRLQHRRARRFAFFPAAHRLDVLADMRGDFALSEAGARLPEQASGAARVTGVLAGNFCGHYDLRSSHFPYFLRTLGRKISGPDAGVGAVHG